MAALLDAARDGDYPAEIALVASNAPTAAGLAAAEAAGVPVAAIDQGAFRGDKPGFEAALDRALRSAGVEIICLAGFMRVLSGAFVARWPDRILNIHPSLLPAFPGLDTHARALAAGVKIHGATVHLARAEVDSGPILAQAALSVRPEDTAETLAARVLKLEHALYPAALKRFVLDAGRVPTAWPASPDALTAPALAD